MTLKKILPCLLLGLALSSCSTMPKRPPVTDPPRVACEERAPAEPMADAPVSADWRVWRRARLGAIGIATAEVEKRATTADCLDALREKGLIR